MWVDSMDRADQGLFNRGSVDIAHLTFNGGIFEDSQSSENAHV